MKATPRKSTDTTPYTPEELIDMLGARRGGLSLEKYAAEIGISIQLLSQILKGNRSVGSRRVLAFLAPTGKRFVRRNLYYLVRK